MNAIIANRHQVNKPTDCCSSSGEKLTKSVQQPVTIEDYETIHTVSFTIDGMNCISCVNRIETALSENPGVIQVFVDLATRLATIHFDPATIDQGILKAVIEAVGYSAKENNADAKNMTKESHEHFQTQKVGLYPFTIGISAALGVIGFYLGLQTLASDWYFAKVQFAEFRWWIAALSIGLGVQVTLFTYMQKRLRGTKLKAAKSGLATSGGMSTLSMAACCAHYLVPLLAAIGLPFLSAAAAGIADYQTEFFLLGVLSNLFGLGVMLRLMQKNGILKLGILKAI